MTWNTVSGDFVYRKDAATCKANAAGWKRCKPVVDEAPLLPVAMWIEHARKRSCPTEGPIEVAGHEYEDPAHPIRMRHVVVEHRRRVPQNVVTYAA